MPGIDPITDFSAAGDGTTDDTTAIQNALTAAASDEMLVSFPPGEYLVTDTLHLPHLVSIKGISSSFRLSSESAVHIKFRPPSAGTTCFALDYDKDTRPYREGGTYSNLLVSGDSNTLYLFDMAQSSYATWDRCYLLGGTTSNQCAALVRFEDAMLCTFHNCKMANSSEALFKFTRTSNTTTQIKFWGCYMTGATTPYAFTAAANSMQIYLMNTEVESTLGGVNMAGGNSVQAVMSQLIHHDNNAFNFTTSDLIRLIGCGINCDGYAFNGKGGAIELIGGSISGSNVFSSLNNSIVRIGQ